MSDGNVDHATRLFGRWADITRNELAAELAAAEERGRRSGVEEAATLCDHRANGHDVGSAAGLEARKCANAVRDLAPRDSAPDPDPTCPEDFEPPWPRDSGKEDQR